MRGKQATFAPGNRPLLVICLAFLAAAGCDRKEPVAQPIEPETQQTTTDMPKISGLKEAGLAEDEALGSTEVLVKEKFDRSERETYTWDSKHPAGTIKGGCRIRTKKGMTFPPQSVIELTGENAIRKPRPKEVEYYKTIAAKRPNYISRQGRAKYGYTYIPYNVVVMLRDVKVGRRRPLSRPVMMIRQGVLQPGDDVNHGGNNIQFSPIHERAQFTTWDAFPSEIVITRHGAKDVLFRKPVRYVQTEENKPKRHETGHLVYKPEFVTTPPIREPGMYAVSDARHPWIKGYLIVADNPYVTVTTYHKYYPLCNFQISGVPPGRHLLEVWHPLYKPVKPTVEVTVEANKVTELMILFHPPE